MKTEVVTLTTDKYDEWDKFVDISPQGDVFCYSWWLDTVTKSRFKVNAVIEDGEIVAGMPLAYDKYGKINEPFLTRTLGILFASSDNLSEYRQISNQRKWLNALLECIPARDFAQMCLHHSIKDCLPFKWKGFKQTTRYTYILKYEKVKNLKLYDNLNAGIRHSIRQAERNNIKVFESDDISLLYEYAIMSFKRQGLKLRLSLEEIQVLDHAIKNNGNRMIFKAVGKDGKVHAMNYLSFNNKSAYHLLSGSDPAERKAGGHTLVLWEAIKYFSDKVQSFNFGGSNIRRVEEHFRGFGGEITPYFHIYKDDLLDQGIRTHLNGIAFHFKGLGTSLIRKMT